MCGAYCETPCPGGYTCDAFGHCIGGDPQHIVLNEEPGFPVSGTITINGQRPTKDATYCSASLNLGDSIAVVSFTDEARGYSGSYTITCASQSWDWNFTLPAGTYDFRVSRGGYSQGAGVNLLPVSYLAAEDVKVSGPVANLVLNEEPGFPVSGTITINGQRPTKDATYCSASLNLGDSIAVVSFTDEARGYSGSYTITCASQSWDWNFTLPAGTYDFRVSRGGYSQGAGVNLLPVSYLAAEDVKVSGPVANLVLNEEPGFPVSGTITIDGQRPTKDATYCSASLNLGDSIAVVSFTDEARGYSGSYTITCASQSWDWNFTLPAGTYDFRVSRGGYSQGAGVNLLPVSYLAAERVVIP